MIFTKEKIIMFLLVFPTYWFMKFVGLAFYFIPFLIGWIIGMAIVDYCRKHKVAICRIIRCRYKKITLFIEKYLLKENDNV